MIISLPDALLLRKQEIEDQLVAALASGDPIEVTPAFWEERRCVFEERLVKGPRGCTFEARAGERRGVSPPVGSAEPAG